MTKEREIKKRKGKAYKEEAVGKIPEEAASLLTSEFRGRFEIQNLSLIGKIAISVDLLHLRE